VAKGKGENGARVRLSGAPRVPAAQPPAPRGDFGRVHAMDVGHGHGAVRISSFMRSLTMGQRGRPAMATNEIDHVDITQVDSGSELTASVSNSRQSPR